MGWFESQLHRFTSSLLSGMLVLGVQFSHLYNGSIHIADCCMGLCQGPGIPSDASVNDGAFLLLLLITVITTSQSRTDSASSGFFPVCVHVMSPN